MPRSSLTSPLPRRPKGSVLCSRASPLSWEPEWGHRHAGAGQAGNQAGLLSCASTGSTRDGNSLVKLLREPALARKPARTLTLKDQPTKVGLRPGQLMERILQNPQQSLAREKQVRWVQFILHSHHVITTTLEGRNSKGSLREIVLSSNQWLNYSEYKTAVYNLWSPAHLLGKCSEEACFQPPKYNAHVYFYSRENTFYKRITVKANIHCHLPRARYYVACIPWITSSSPGDNSLDRDKYCKRRKQRSWGVYSLPWQVAEQGSQHYSRLCS